MSQEKTVAGGITLSLIAMYHIKNFGPRYVHSFLKTNNEKVNLIFFKNSYLNNASKATTEEIDRLVGLLKDLKTDLAALSIGCSSYFKTACAITAKIKKGLDIPVLWGGIHPTISPEECIQQADMICLGEGEEAMLELLTQMREGKDVSQIKNLWVKSNGRLVRNELRLLRQDLDTLPFPDYSPEDKYYLDQDQVSYGDPIYNECWDYMIKTTRGCPYQCTYCSNQPFNQLYSQRGKFIRQRSVPNVIKELLYAKECFGDRIRLVNFFDELFGLNLNWLEEFREAYKQKIGLPFGLLLHPLYIKDKEITILKDAGAFGIGMGIQSGSVRVRREVYKRPESDQQIIQALEVMHKHHIQEINIDLINDNPFETEDDKRQALKLLLQMSRPFRIMSYSLIYFPGAEISDMALKAGLISPQQIEGQSEKILSQFIATFDYKKRSPQETAWIAIFSLTGNPFIPKNLLSFLSEHSFFMSHPIFVILLARIANPLYRYLSKGWQMLLTRQVNLALIKKLIWRKNNRSA